MIRPLYPAVVACLTSTPTYWTLTTGRAGAPQHQSCPPAGDSRVWIGLAHPPAGSCRRSSAPSSTPPSAHRPGAIRVRQLRRQLPRPADRRSGRQFAAIAARIHSNHVLTQRHRGTKKTLARIPEFHLVELADHALKPQGCLRRQVGMSILGMRQGVTSRGWRIHEFTD